MGLDSYLISLDTKYVINDFSFEGYETWDFTFDEAEIFYARRNHLIHDWMTDLYRSKGGPNNIFNCEYVRLTKSDVDLFEEDIQDEEQFASEEDIERARELVSIANFHFNQNKVVYYYSSW